MRLLFAISILVFTGCKQDSVEIHLSGEIHPYDSSRDYNIFIVENDAYKNKVIEVIENEDLPNGKLNFSFNQNLNFQAILEVRVDDTVRCVLIPAQSNYLKNPVSGSISRIEIAESRSEFKVNIHNIDFDLDFSEERLFDYNTHFLNPVIEVEQDYKKISGRIDSLPKGSRLVILADGGSVVKQYDFQSSPFELNTPFKMDYLNIYVHSQFGWQRHLKEYDIGKLSLNFN